MFVKMRPTCRTYCPCLAIHSCAREKRLGFILYFLFHQYRFHYWDVCQRIWVRFSQIRLPSAYCQDFGNYCCIMEKLGFMSNLNCIRLYTHVHPFLVNATPPAFLWVLRGSVIKCLIRNAGVLVRATLDPLGFLGSVLG